ncbi:hypothetical protein D3C78_1993900 [compost metagenome]
MDDDLLDAAALVAGAVAVVDAQAGGAAAEQQGEGEQGKGLHGADGDCDAGCPA